MPNRTTNRWILAGVVGAVLLWCGIHSVGVWRHDRRGVLAIIASTGLFFGLWTIGFALGKLAHFRSEPPAGTPNQLWNLPSVFALIVAFLSVLALAPELIRMPQTIPWLHLGRSAAAVCTALALILAMIGLSHPSVHRGKLFGMAALAIVLLNSLAAGIRFWWIV